MLMHRVKPFGDDVFHLGALVEGRHWILKNHLNLGCDFLIKGMRNFAADPLPFEADFTRSDRLYPDERDGIVPMKPWKHG